MSPSRTLSICLSISIATVLSGPAFGELTATFADPAWNGDKVPEGDRSAVESALSELKEALQGEDQERRKELIHS